MAAGSVGRRNLGGCMENPRDLRVHIYELVSLDGKPLISLINRLIHPSFEWVTNYAVGNVADIRPLQPEALLRRRQSVLDSHIFKDFIQNVLDGQALVMRHCDRLNLVALEASLRPRHHVTKEEIGACLKGGNVAAAFI